MLRARSPEVAVPVLVQSKKKNGTGIAVAIVCGVILVALLGVTIGLLVKNKNGGCGKGKDNTYVKNQYIKLAKMSLGSMAEGVSEDSLERAGMALHNANVRAGRSGFHVTSLSNDQARALLAQTSGSAGNAAVKAGTSHAAMAPRPPASAHPKPHAHPMPHAHGNPKGAETQALTKAFQGGLDNPPCQFNIPVDGPGGAPLTAQQMSPLGYAHTRKAQHAMLKTTPSDCPNETRGGSGYGGYGVDGKQSMMEAMQTTADATTGKVFAGKLPAEYAVDKTAAAIAAVGGAYGPGPNLEAANYTPNSTPGMLFDGNLTFAGSRFVQPGTTNNVADAGQSSSAVLSGNDIQVDLALTGEDAARHAKAFDLSSKLPGSALLTGDQAELSAQNSKNLQLLAKANPEQAAQLLLNAGQVGRVNAASMLNAHLGASAATYSVMAEPVFRTWNFRTSSYTMPGGVGLAVPTATTYDGATMGVPSPFFDAWRQTQCS